MIRTWLNRYPWLVHGLLLLPSLFVVGMIVEWRVVTRLLPGYFVSHVIQTVVAYTGMLAVRIVPVGSNYHIVMMTAYVFLIAVVVVPQVLLYALRKWNRRLLFGIVFFIEYLIIAVILNTVDCRINYRCVNTFSGTTVSREELYEACGRPLHYSGDRAIYTDGIWAVGADPDSTQDSYVYVYVVNNLWLD